MADALPDDTEDTRRARNTRRWRLLTRGERSELMAALAELDPAVHAELEALRAAAPQSFRKQLVAEAKKRGLYEAKAWPEREAG